MIVLELGQYVAPAYAGMVLAEQGHCVEKWYQQNDPVLGLHNGKQLWKWLQYGKVLQERHSREVVNIPKGRFDVIIDNHRADAWQRWGIDPAEVAEALDVVWVSLRADDDERSFDVIAQARAWGDRGMLPFYIGDTAAGLWLAFKAVATRSSGHYVIRQAAALAKLVEGELVVDRSQPWDAPGTYGFDEYGAYVEYRGERIVEPYRDDDWRRKHLEHDDGRFRV